MNNGDEESCDGKRALVQDLGPSLQRARALTSGHTKSNTTSQPPLLFHQIPSMMLVQALLMLATQPCPCC